MYDPLTVAFEIKSPFRGERSKLWPKGYRKTLVTIWHKDPERPGRGHRTDDSCGWFSPPTTKDERERIRVLGERQWSELFSKRHQLAKGDPERYAYICYEPSAYDAVYWAWRAIKREDTKDVWQYGKSGVGYLSPGEMETIYSLAACPVDNVRVTVAGIKNAEDCADFFSIVYRAYRRFHRPWWCHPRWHFWHWRIQIHALQKLTRRLFVRCASCGKPFDWNETPIGEWNGDRCWHERCAHGGDRAAAAVMPDGAAGVFRPAVIDGPSEADSVH